MAKHTDPKQPGSKQADPGPVVPQAVSQSLPDAEFADAAPPNALEELAAALGKPSQEILDAILAGTTQAALVADGRRIDGNRVVKDISRLYWQAYDFYRQADAEQRKKLRGFTLPLFTVAVHQALALKNTYADRKGKATADSSAREQVAQVAKVAAADSTNLRDQAQGVLERVALKDEPYATQVSKAVVSIKTTADRANNLTNLANVLEGWLKLPAKTPIRVRLEAAGLDEEYLKEMRATAKQVLKASSSAEIRGGSTDVTQGQLDYEDGLNLLFLDMIIHAFDAAHDRDPTIPRLTPLSTRHFFGRGPRKPAGGTTPGGNGGGTGGNTGESGKPAAS